MKLNIRNIITGIIIIIVIGFSIKKTLELNKNDRLIESNPKVIIGRISSYSEVGVANYYMTYEYSVENESYSNKIIPKKLFKDCQHDNSCIEKEIYVEYFKDKPEISRVVWDSLPSR